MLIEILLLAFGVPIVLLGLLLLLERFESWLVEPGERAARVVELLHSAEEPEEVEQATVKMLELVVPAERQRSRAAVSKVGALRARPTPGRAAEEAARPGASR